MRSDQSETNAVSVAGADAAIAEARSGAGQRYMLCTGVAFLLFQLLGPAWRTGFPVAFPDSSSYIGIAESGVLSWNFWFGQRPPTYPLLIWIVGPSPRAIVVAQTLISVACWAWLLSTAWTLIRSRWVAGVAVVMLVLVAADARWLLWSTAVLTESLSASLAVAGVASWWRWWAEPTRFRTAAATMITVAWMLLRDSNAISLLVVVVPAFALLLKMERGRSSDRRRLLAVGLTVMIVTGGYSVTSQVVSNRGETSLHNNVALRYLPDAEMTAWMEARGMPMSAALSERSGKDAWADGEAMLQSSRLVEYRQWAEGTGKVAVAGSFVVKADWYLARANSELPRYTGGDQLSYDTFGVANHFPRRPLWRLAPVDSRTTLYVWALLTLGALGLLWADNRTTAWLGLFLFVPVIFDLYLVFVADAVEVGRHLVGPFLRFSVVTIVIVAIAVDPAVDAQPAPETDLA